MIAFERNFKIKEKGYVPQAKQIGRQKSAFAIPMRLVDGVKFPDALNALYYTRCSSRRSRSIFPHFVRVHAHLFVQNYRSACSSSKIDARESFQFIESISRKKVGVLADFQPFLAHSILLNALIRKSQNSTQRNNSDSKRMYNAHLI